MLRLLAIRDEDTVKAEAALRNAGVRIYVFTPISDNHLERAMFDDIESENVKKR